MNDEKKRILHIIPGYGGGISSYVRNIVSSIDSNKIIIDVIGFSEYSSDFREEIESKCGKLFTLPRIHKDGIFSIISFYKNVLKKEGPYCMVHCHFSGPRALFFSIISKLHGIKRFVVHAHRADDEYKGKFSKVNLFIERVTSVLAADNLVSCSNMASRYIFGSKYVLENKVMHLPNSISVKKYCINVSNDKKDSLRNELNINNDKIIIGHIGRFNIQKNHLFMVEIIKEMKNRNLNFIWLFIGDGEELENIKKLINKNDCEDYVRFLGRREDVNVLYSIIDVIVLPSFFEGLPTVIVEAQAAGVPSVVSSNVTTEVDMKIGILKFIDLEEDLDIWIKNIVDMSKVYVPNKKNRIEYLNRRHFTSESSAKLYEDFIYKKILFNELK